MSKVEVYYFSGTGNSLAVARGITDNTNGKLISMLIVKRFIKNMDNLASKYIFAVCTNRGWSGSTIGNLNKLIKSRNSNLAAKFTVKMPDNSTVRTTAEEQNKFFNSWKRKLVNICNYICARKKGKYETSNILIKILFAPLFSILNT